MNRISQCASFLYLNGFPKSTSFHAECSDAFYKREFNAANSLSASEAKEFFARNSISVTDKVLSKVSDTFSQVGNKSSEASDCFAQFWKMLSETSDSFAQFEIMPSETSDDFTTIETCSFYSVDSYFGTQGFGLILPFFKNLRENLKKNKKTCNFHLVDVFYLLS